MPTPEEVAAIAAAHGIAVDFVDASRCAAAMEAVLGGGVPLPDDGRALEERPRSGDDPLNALVRRCDAPASAPGPLSGLRLAIKDSIAVGGVPLSGGSAALGGFVPSADSEVVRRLRAAGAEVVAIASMDDLAISGAGVSARYGKTLNPRDSNRGAGGSSGGCAAALSYAGIDAALGTDLAGSVRIPASWCGVLALKPTRGLIPARDTIVSDPRFDTVGPLATSARTLALLLAALADVGDGERAGYDAATTAGGDLRGLRIAAVSEGFDADLGVDPAVAEVVRAALRACAELGAEVGELSLPAHCEASRVFAPFGRAAAAAILDGAPAAASPELSAALGRGVRECWDQLPLIVKVAGLLGWKQERDGGIPAAADVARAELESRFDRLLDEVDLVAMPTTPTVARRHLGPGASPAETVTHAWANAENTSVANLTGQPAITLPVAACEGLPAGLQLIARKGGEAVLLRVAAAWEAAFGWAA